MALFFNIADDVRGTEGVTRFDHDGLRLALALRTPRRTSIMRLASNSARPDVMSYIGALALALTWRTSHRPKGVLLAVALSGGAGLIGLMKQRYGRERQTLIEALVREGTFSFPSGHAFISLTFYGLISGVHLRSDRSFAEKTAVCITSAGTTLLIGSSRVYLGAHYPSDVLAGYAAAVPWLTALLIANSQYEDRVERRAIAAAEAKK
jgi:undecaprenyl-diphosphatase